MVEKIHLYNNIQGIIDIPNEILANTVLKIIIFILSSIPQRMKVERIYEQEEREILWTFREIIKIDLSTLHIIYANINIDTQF